MVLTKLHIEMLIHCSVYPSSFKPWGIVLVVWQILNPLKNYNVTVACTYFQTDCINKLFEVLLQDLYTHKASTVLAEGGLDIRGLIEGVYEPHLTVEQGAGLHEIVNHLFSTDLPIPEKS